MATAVSRGVKEFVFEWEGKDRNGKQVRGETRAAGENQVQASLRRQGVFPTKIKKRRMGAGKRIKPKDIAIFTRQLATMMKAGVPLLQAFDIVGRGNANASVTKLLNDIRMDVETGSSLSAAFRKFPMQFNALYCNLVEAGEAAGILEALLDRLATYMEKTEAIKSKIKSALMYPISVIIVAFVVVTVIMIFVIPAFKDVFSSFGADLPAPTLFVIAISEFFVAYWWLIFGGIGGTIYFMAQAWKRNVRVQRFMDRAMLKMPVFGVLIEKSCVARWTRTLSTMFAAGVPLVEALDSVGGASGNSVYAVATDKIQQEVSVGTSLTTAMTNANVFPTMVLQMCSIGEESGSIDHMLGKAADFYEEEVDDMVAGLSSLMEPIIIVFLGGLIGGIVVSMYLPIFKLGRGLMLMVDWLNAAIGGVLGLLVGSFLNVVVYRTPAMMYRSWLRESSDNLMAADPAYGVSTSLWDLVFGGRKPAPPHLYAAAAAVGKDLDALAPLDLIRPRSRCGHCAREIRWYENVPVLSYVALRGRCSGCKTRISPRYPLVELTTALLFALCTWRWGLSPLALAWAAFAALLLCQFLIDLDTQLLPDPLNYLLLWSGLVVATLGWTVPLASAVWGAVAGYGVLWCFFHAYRLLTSKEGMGYGDFKLLAALGAWLGADHLLAILLLSSVVGAVLGGAMLLRGRLAHKDVPIAFGPFLAGAGLVCLIAGPDRVRHLAPFFFPWG